MNDSKEFYQCPPGSNCGSAGLPLAAKTLQEVHSGCPDCASIHASMKIRTDYDQHWLRFYNQRAQNFDTDLMKLRFLR